jgi:biotin carboxyl carrier protein
VAFDIASPKDGTIKGLSVADGAAVNIGDTICNISDDEERIALGRLTAAQGLTQLDANLLSPNQLQLQRSLMQIAVTVTQQYVSFAQTKLTFEQQALTSGTGDTVKVSQANAGLQKALGEQQKATLALQTFNFNVQQAQAKQAISNAQLTAEIAFMTEMQARLTIKAPLSGTIVTVHTVHRLWNHANSGRWVHGVPRQERRARSKVGIGYSSV